MLGMKHNTNIKDCFEIHLAFILTALVTYALGIVIVAVESKLKGYFWPLLIEALVPTTITYVLGCVLANIVDMLKNTSEHYIYNILTCISVFVYALLYIIYLIVGFCVSGVIIEIILTIALLYLNGLCYKEKYVNRNHGLV